MLQTPIIIEKRHQAKSMSTHKQLTERKANLKKVEPFVPLNVTKRDHYKMKVDTMPTESSSRTKEIEIFLDSEGDDRECLKKLFKKIHNLTDQLQESEKERIRMQL